MFKSYKDESRANWGRETNQNALTRDEIQHGAILRIADATEAMAKNHVQLQAERDRLQRWYDQERDRAAKLERSNAALRGQITRLKNRINQGVAHVS
jgi:hypothetical protein